MTNQDADFLTALARVQSMASGHVPRISKSDAEALTRVLNEMAKLGAHLETVRELREYDQRRIARLEEEVEALRAHVPELVKR